MTVLKVPDKIDSWSVRLAYVKVDKGVGGMESLLLDSSGQVATEHQWVTGKKGAKPEHDKAESKAAPEGLAGVVTALKDPELSLAVPPGNAANPWQMTLTVNGMTATFFSSDGKFPGAAGRVLAAAEKAAPWPKSFVAPKR
jgi:hypothetical protein